MGALIVSSRWILARTLYRLSGSLSLEPMGMGTLAKEYAKTIEEDGLDSQPLPPGPLARLCQGAGVTTIQHAGKSCVSWSKPTKAFVSQALAESGMPVSVAERAEAEPEPEADREADRPGPRDGEGDEPAGVSAVEASAPVQAEVGDDIDFAGDFHGLTPPEAQVQPVEDEWTMFVRDKRRTGDDVAYVRRTAIAITARAAASIGLTRGSKVTLFSGRPGRIKLQIDASNPNALTMTGDGSTAATLKCSAHAFVRDHRLTLGRYRLEPIGDGAAVLTLVEAATPAA